MHELALSQSIVDLVLERARVERVRTVTRVVVAVGTAAGVDAEALIPGIAGLRAGIRFVTSVGVTSMGEHDAMLARVAVEGLRRIDGVRVLCGPDAPRTGVVSFTVDGLDVALAAAMLDESAGIAVRSGLHCAPAAHRALGTFPTGTVRVSFGHFNTREHAEALVATVRDIARSARS